MTTQIEKSETSSKDFSREVKSEAFMVRALKAALKCEICKGYIHLNSMQFDHIQRKSEGGPGTVENAQLSHPYCNTTFKHYIQTLNQIWSIMVTDFSFVAVLSMAVAFAALGITIIIAHRQEKQTEEVASATDEIHDMTSEQAKLISDTRDFYAGAFVGYVRLISDRYANVITLYENKFRNQPISEQKENVRRMLKDYYDNFLTENLPKIEAIELVKVFGREIADKHWTHTVKMTSSMWQVDDDYEIALMIDSFIKQMQKLVELKDAFLPFCVESYRNDDSDFQENYDLIKKFADSAVKPKRDDFDGSISYP